MLSKLSTLVIGGITLTVLTGCVSEDGGSCSSICDWRTCGAFGGCSCGICPDDYNCINFTCEKTDCQSNCSGRECGPDPNCGQSCGTCGSNESCKNGQCIFSGCYNDDDCNDGKDCTIDSCVNSNCKQTNRPKDFPCGGGYSGGHCVDGACVDGPPEGCCWCWTNFSSNGEDEGITKNCSGYLGCPYEGYSSDDDGYCGDIHGCDCTAPCPTATTCWDCIALSSCGWCKDGGTCAVGGSQGPHSGSCSNWVLSSSGCGGCQPKCSGKECGSDGCGGSCGSCYGGKTCSNGKCVSNQTSIRMSARVTCYNGQTIPWKVQILVFDTSTGGLVDSGTTSSDGYYCSTPGAITEVGSYRIEIFEIGTGKCLMYYWGLSADATPNLFADACKTDIPATNLGICLEWDEEYGCWGD